MKTTDVNTILGLQPYEFWFCVILIALIILMYVGLMIRETRKYNEKKNRQIIRQMQYENYLKFKKEYGF